MQDYKTIDCEVKYRRIQGAVRRVIYKRPVHHTTFRESVCDVTFEDVVFNATFCKDVSDVSFERGLSDVIFNGDVNCISVNTASYEVKFRRRLSNSWFEKLYGVTNNGSIRNTILNEQNLALLQKARIGVPQRRKIA